MASVDHHHLAFDSSGSHMRKRGFELGHGYGTVNWASPSLATQSGLHTGVANVPKALYQAASKKAKSSLSESFVTK